MSLTDLLLACRNSHEGTRSEAEKQLQNAESNNFEQYMVALARELSGQDRPPTVRQLAGLCLKNGICAKDATRNARLKERWMQLPSASRDAVKEGAQSALICADTAISRSAAQVLAKIGAIEIPPPGQWTGLLPLLLTHVQNTDPRAKQIALITVGYLCDDLVQISDGVSLDDKDVSNILTIVVHGMRDPDPATKLEAAKALYHAVVLGRKNFQNEAERNVIMTVVIETCSQPNEALQIAGFECLVQIANEYYDLMFPYMNHIGPLTWETIRAAPHKIAEKVAIPAMEFWSTICDEELDLQYLAESGQLGNRQPLNLIKMALTQLIPLLCETLTKQQSEEEDDTCNLAMAAGTCLGLVAEVVGDDCVDLVLQFVQGNFANPDWKYREAAILAYGSIMEGPTSEKMQPVVSGSFGQLVTGLQDPSVAVRDTIAWTLGRIAQFHPSIVPAVAKELTPRLGEKLQDVPRVAANVCWVIQVLAENSPGVDSLQAPETTPLSHFFPSLAQALLQVVARPDADERQLRMAGYNALSVLCSKAGNDCLPHMLELTQTMLQQLALSFNQAIDKECELQGYICGVLTSLVQRLREKILPAADRVMEEALKVITTYQQLKGAGLHEEALLLVAALANAVTSNFERFMPHFAPHLKVGLENYEDVQVCLMATGMIGDLCTALETGLAAYCDTILEILYNNLQNTAVDRKIKAAIMSSFGDIALAISGDFEKYLKPVVEMLLCASRTKLEHGPENNEDWIEYLNSLRKGVLEAYTGVILGLKQAGKLGMFKAHVNAVLEFVKEITEDRSASEPVMKAAVGVVYDLVFVFQQELASFLVNAPFLGTLVQFAMGCDDPNTRAIGSQLRQMMMQYGGAAAM